MSVPSGSRRSSRILFSAAAATLAISGNVFAQFETLAVPPLSGFQPLVVMGLTDEQADPNSFDAGAHASSTPGSNGVPGNTLPIDGPQKFFVGVLDTGAQSSIITFDAAQQANLVGANRDGTLQQEVVGASGTEFPTVTDALGVYATGFGNAAATGGSISVTGGTLHGMWNASVLQAEATSSLPNILGAPMLGLYQASIKNSIPYHLNVGTTTYRSPQVDFAPRNSAVPSNYGKVFFQVTQNVGDPPSYEPDFNAVLDPNWDGNFGNNPAVPTIWESFFLNVSVSHTGGAETNSFLFDTGAEVSVLSSQTAADVGIFTTGDNPTKPDFFIEVVGVGGATEEVKGYYVNQLSLTSTSGQITYKRAPVIVLDVPDPRNPNQTLPGVLGTNLLTSRDLVINIGQGNSFLGISPQIAWKATGGGNWSDSTKWGVIVPNGIDTQANFFGSITAPSTITVDPSGFTVGSIAFDNINRYTLDGSGTITLDVSVDHAQINVNSGSHTIAAPMIFKDDTDINVVSASSVLTVTTDISAGTVAINKQGDGVLEMKNIRAAALDVQGGTVRVLPSNTIAAAASKVTAISFGGVNPPAGKLDLGGAPLAIDYATTSPAVAVRSFLQSGFANGAWTGNGITSSTAAAAANSVHKTGLGYAEASAIGNPGSWFGQTITGDAILMRLTYYGDTNLDGTVNSGDFTKLSQNFDNSAAFWSQGDFNYDGVVNALDFNALASNFGQVLPANALGSLVPEPTTLFIIAAATLLRRRSCRQSR